MLYSYQKKDKPLLPAQPPAGPPEHAAGPLQSPPGLPDKHKEDKDSPTPSLGIPKGKISKLEQQGKLLFSTECLETASLQLKLRFEIRFPLVQGIILKKLNF